MTSTAGLYIFGHDFSRWTMGTWRTTHYLKSVGSIGRKRIKSTAPFIGVARAVRANVLPVSANVIINLAIVIFYSTIANIEMLAFVPFGSIQEYLSVGQSPRSQGYRAAHRRPADAIPLHTSRRERLVNCRGLPFTLAFCAAREWHEQRRAGQQWNS
ncbi:hypothetical protein, partial [Burkholderia ubonensis]|uniref:hypothetical protein n=1 Tax=Burkholderia ubonensis TaxID=101571 RepID=UPI001E5CEE9E